MKSKNSQRILSMVMALCLTLGMLPTAAFAVDSNVGPYFGYSDEGIPANEAALTEEGSVKEREEGNLKFSKTIKEQEDGTFDITLKVTTTENLSKFSVDQDAAVVLVLDASISMTWKDDGTQTVNGQAIPEKDQRITHAKTAATNFVEDFAQVAGTNRVQRMVSVVGFNHDIAPQVTGWNNVTIEAGKTAVNNGIENLETASGTNIAHGLSKAQELLASDAVKNIKNKYVILMTDGEPNRRLDGTYFGSNGYQVSNLDIQAGAKEIEGIADRIRENAKIYTLGYALPKNTFYTEAVKLVDMNCKHSEVHFHDDSDIEKYNYGGS